MTALLELAGAHEQAGRLDEAEAIIATLLRSAPNEPHVQHMAGVLAFRRGRLEEAVRWIEPAIAARPDELLFHRNICEIYRVLGRLDAALTHGLRALELSPDDPASSYNLAMVHSDRLEVSEAIRCCRRALELDPFMASAHFELAEALLLSGAFAEGWREYEWRYALPTSRPPLPHKGRKQWDGNPMPDGRLLLIGDQGFGDTIQFCRYIPEVAKRCPNIIMACSPEMYPIISQQPGISAYAERWENIPPFDAYCPLSGLPHRFGTDLATIPAPVPYVQADANVVARWKARLSHLVPAGFRKVGIVWAGRPTHGNDLNRSMALGTLAPLAELENVALVSLQVGPAAGQVTEQFFPAPLINIGAEIVDFVDTAALVSLMDHVVAVDTSVVHLAGAMGRPVSVMLPFAPDWRWLRDRADTPWYPTMRLFRQPAPRTWGPVVAQVRAHLARELRVAG